MIHSFGRLINKYAVTDATLVQQGTQGGYVDGAYVPGTPSQEAPLHCAIVPMSSREVYDTNGRYTTNDRTVYTQTQLNIKDTISYRNVTYSVEEQTDYSMYADFFMYKCKAVSKFG